MTVTVVKVKRECFLDSLQVTGVLAPRNEILVRSDRNGMQISQVLVDAGDVVASGQVLARLTAPDGQQAPPGPTAVQAPAAGTVIARAAVIGMSAAAPGEPLFRIAAKGDLELVADAPAKILAGLKSDQPAKIEIVGVGELPGKVRSSPTGINPTTQLGQVRVAVDADPRLRVGAFGRASIEVGRRCGPSVPLSAVLYNQAGPVAQTVRSGLVETQPVRLGVLAKGQAEIREGLTEGEEVVARAGAFLRDGDRVRVIAAPEAPAKR
ncbi:MAG: efflux RND transporter periplasmic adaptor subunit [Xanthobacteraceae bacterium]